MAKLEIPIFCDEMNMIASKVIQKGCFLGDPTLFQLIKMGREFGIGFFTATSEPTALSDTIKTNSSTKVLMNLGRFEEQMDIGRGMNLSKEQLKYATGLLPGQGIMKLENIDPFPVTFPNIEIVKNITDKDIDEHNERLLRGTEFEYLIKQKDEPQPESIMEKQEEELSLEQKAFLWDIYNRPYLSIKERMNTINI